MRCPYSIANVTHQSSCPLNGQPPFARQYAAQGLTANQLHNDKRRLQVTFRIAEIMNRYDVRMMKPGCCASFTPKALDCLRFGNVLAVQQLHRDFIADMLSLCPKDCPHG